MSRHCLLTCLLLLPTLAWPQLITGKAENLLAGAAATASGSAGAVGAKYGPQDAVDGKLDTWWAANNKLPVWLDLRLAKPQALDTLVLQNADNPTLYTNLKQVTVAFSDGTSLQQELDDSRGPFLVRFPARLTDWVRLTVTAVHDPAKTYVGLASVLAYSDPAKQVYVKVPVTATWRKPDLTEQGRTEHPCVYLTPADVAAARERVKTAPWAKAYAASVVASADQALSRPEDWFGKMVPAHGACFAYGLTGCPICRASWGTWGGARCSWDNPGHVTCGNGHVLPDAEHPDAGTGWKNPDGRIHYFVGSWNAWVVEQFQDWASSLAVAYSLTGEEKYAARAALILDTLADLYPSCDKGSWDYPSSPPSGRLCRPWYQVARVLVPLVNAYDQVYGSPALEQPSVTAGLTRRQNIERNMLKNGAWYCYEQSLHGGLNNGEADYIRGALAVGCLLGIEHYVNWAYDGPYGILALVHNNVCRDGRYFETSVMYADHSRELYLTFADPLYNYRSTKYPRGIDVYDDPVFQSFYTLPATAMSCLGHSPRFGDSGPDTARALPPRRPGDPLDEHFAEVLYARSEGQAHADFGRLLSYLCRGDVGKARAGAPSPAWLLFHAAPAPQGEAKLPEWLNRRLNATNYFGQKGLAFLRTPNSPAAQAALIRFGPSLNHGHADDLNLNYYALGYELTYDLGYSLGSTHTQVGWAKQTASHNLVLVDEKPQGGAADKDGSGGSLYLLAGLPGLQVADCSAECTYASVGVSEYRRACALVGNGPDTYLLDLFRVTGGRQHDYVFHALSDEAEFTGADFSAPQAGSLAGPDLAWGDKQLNDGDMAGHPNQPYWNPPPGNGLGFLMAPRRAAAQGTFTATWNLTAGGAEDCHLRMTLLPEPGTELITAWAPGIYPQKGGSYSGSLGLPRSRYVLARRRGEGGGLQSTYAAVYEPYGPPPPAGVHDAAELGENASCSGGEIKPISSLGVLLFKATGPEDELRLPVAVDRPGSYAISAKVYGSPNYGRAQLALDGQPFEKLLNGNDEVNGGSATVFPLGTRTLTAGKHAFALKISKPAAGNYWLGLVHLAVSPAEAPAASQPAAPFLRSVERLASPAGTTAVKVTHVSGQVDQLLYSLQPGQETTCGDGLSSDAAFARVRTRGAKVSDLNLVGGAHLAARGLRVTLPQGVFRGSLSRVDYAANELHTAAKLPADGRLTGALVYLGNPGYSRNTVYRIAAVRAEGSGSVIELGRTSLVLGFAELDEDPADEHALTTLNPHEYSRALGRPDSHFFHGKLLATADGKIRTTIRSTYHAQPFQISVDSTAGLRKGQRVYYYDVREGDSFVIYNTCSVEALPDGTARLTGSADVTLGGVKVEVAGGNGKWTAARGGRIGWKAEGTVVRLK